MTSEAQLSWCDDHCTLIHEVDYQHKELFRLLDGLQRAVMESRDRKTTLGLLDLLATRTQAHFTLEEDLMRTPAYPGYKSHKNQHDELMQEINRVQTRLNTEAGSITVELLLFLRYWLLHHIRESDKAFAAYFQARS